VTGKFFIYIHFKLC